MERQQAIEKAIRKAEKDGKVRYVIYECGEFEVATENDLRTFFDGCDDPIFCTLDMTGGNHGNYVQKRTDHGIAER